MTNFAANMLKVTGKAEDLAEFTSTIEGEFSFSQTVPKPESEPETCEWYEKNWGTKWGAVYPDIEINEDTEIVIFFSTAWDPPTAWLKKVAALFPKLRFRIAWSQICGGGYGVMAAKGDMFKDVFREVGKLEFDEEGRPIGRYGRFLERYETGTGS